MNKLLRHDAHIQLSILVLFKKDYIYEYPVKSLLKINMTIHAGYHNLKLK